MSDDAAFVDLGFARVDVDRRRRTGFPEVIFGQGKTPEEVAQIARVILEREPVLLATRVSLANSRRCGSIFRPLFFTNEPAA